MKLLYLSGVEWKTIIQRHQKMFLELSRYFDCTLLDVYKVFRKHKYVDNPAPLPEKYMRAYQMPYLYEIALFRKITEGSYRKCIGDASRYDVIWITAPQLIDYIPEGYLGRVVYDCVDNHEAFTRKESRRAKLRDAEKKALARADYVFVTSRALEDRLNGLYQEIGAEDGSPVLLRNACSGGQQYPLKQAKVKSSYVIAFIGFVGKWVDQDILQRSTESYPDITYRFVGPFPEKKYDTEQMDYRGSVAHDRLYEAVEDADCFILPFYINSLTIAVDPIKMYEYIAFGKCIISCYYGELEHFREFVWFYDGEEEYLRLLERLRKEGFPPKYSVEQRSRFLEENTWEARGLAAAEIIGHKEE